ncbi:class II aldolase/adducin family protein [Actinomycetota bacterium]
MTSIRKVICKIEKMLFDRKLTDSSRGNISVRDGDKIYINPRKTGHINSVHKYGKY